MIFSESNPYPIVDRLSVQVYIVLKVKYHGREPVIKLTTSHLLIYIKLGRPLKKYCGQ